VSRTENTILEKDLSLRISIGSAALLGLKTVKAEVLPTTVYTLLGEICTGRCRFCAQACDNRVDKRFLSRVTWPEFSLSSFIDRIRTFDKARRICIQTLKYPELPADLICFVNAIKDVSDTPISVCINPLSKGLLLQLRKLGVDRVGIGLDCASRRVFKKIKPGFNWDSYTQFINDVVDIFGIGTVHLIVGLGESDEEMVQQLQRLTDMNCSIGLFAFTPIKGTGLSLQAPEIGRYRAVQLARHLIVHNSARENNMTFEKGKIQSINVSTSIVENALNSSQTFQTSGCPNCNRPMYNERPRGVIYNYASPLSLDEIKKANIELNNYLHV
jgi:lipoyl synthase